MRTKWLMFSSIKPSLVQERVTGISLWDMIDHESEHDDPSERRVKPEYESLVPEISRQLKPVAAPGLSHHVNWHIKNFVFGTQTKLLYYFDLKPSNIFGRWRNERNLHFIRRDFRV